MPLPRWSHRPYGLGLPRPWVVPPPAPKVREYETELSLATVGVDGCRGWLAALAMNRNTVAQAGEAWHLAKYVDILAFSHLLFANWPAVAGIAAIAVAVIALAWLGREWWRSDNARMDPRLWAATLCFTLVVNPYVPIYDSILVVCAVALMASVGQVPAGWLLALYLIPWVTQSFAEFLHLQLMTIVLAAFAVWVMEKAGKPTIGRFIPREEESTMTPLLPAVTTGRF